MANCNANYESILCAFLALLVCATGASISSVDAITDLIDIDAVLTNEIHKGDSKRHFISGFPSTISADADLDFGSGWMTHADDDDEDEESIERSSFHSLFTGAGRSSGDGDVEVTTPVAAITSSASFTNHFQRTTTSSAPPTTTTTTMKKPAPSTTSRVGSTATAFALAPISSTASISQQLATEREDSDIFIEEDEDFEIAEGSGDEAVTTLSTSTTTTTTSTTTTTTRASVGHSERGNATHAMEGLHRPGHQHAHHRGHHKSHEKTKHHHHPDLNSALSKPGKDGGKFLRNLETSSPSTSASNNVGSPFDPRFIGYWTQPWMLAVLVGGVIVVLLFIVLLALIAVYNMKMTTDKNLFDLNESFSPKIIAYQRTNHSDRWA